MKAGIQNKSTRVYNLATRTPKGKMVHINLIPGFNIVEASQWKAFVNGDKIHPYVKTLKGDGMIAWGKELDAKAEAATKLPKADYAKEVANANVKSKEANAPKSNKVIEDTEADAEPPAGDPDAGRAVATVIPAKSTEPEVGTEESDDWLDS